MQLKAKDKKQKTGFTPTLTFFSFFLRHLKTWFRAGVLGKKFVFSANNMKNASAKRKLVWGFTLVETLVAIAILLLAIGGPLTIAAQSFFAARFSKDTLTATYLAQEGVEIVRFQRDSNTLAGADWLSGMENCLGGKCYRGAFSSNPVLNSCSVECVPMGYNETTGQYGYGSIPVSKYVREIQIVEISEVEVVVNSTVKWSNGSIEREVELKENLYNWR